MTPLEAVIAGQIQATGPLRMDDYMRLCLLHPEHGYYATRDPLGVQGDFTTAPEISQMFGELLGLALAQAWLDQGAPGAFVLAEPGPGRGTLMADILRATRAVPGFHTAARVHLVEASPALRKVQRKTLAGVDVTWHDSLETLPDAPLFCVANEFFDALPVRQLVRDGTGWRERVIGLRDGRLEPGLTEVKSVPLLDCRLADTSDGDLVEYCPEGVFWARALGQRIAKHGGTAILVDYGDWRSLGDTVQAVRGHTTAKITETPGNADLSAHVDFEALAQAAAPARHSRLTPQGVFLERLGITARAQALATALTGDRLDTHVAAHRRLTHPDEMGTLFKVMALYPEGAAPPPGLEP